MKFTFLGKVYDIIRKFDSAGKHFAVIRIGSAACVVEEYELKLLDKAYNR